LAILGLIGEYRRGVVKIDAGTTWIFAVGAIFLWIRLWIGIRIAQRLGDSTVRLTSIGLVVSIVNSFVFISLNSRAAAKLRAAGVNVGLFGVYPREMRKLKAAANSGFAEPNQNG
jgi:hypothetical protein